MNSPLDRYILTALSTAILASFAWGMAFHFQRSSRLSSRARLTASLGTTNAILQLIALQTETLVLPTLALVLYLLSAILFWSAVSVSRRRLNVCFQPDCTDSPILTAGPYRWVRHPFYTSYSLSWIAGSIATAWWPTLIPTIALFALYYAAASLEETSLLAGPNQSAYAAYRNTTGRFIPCLRWQRPTQSHLRH